MRWKRWFQSCVSSSCRLLSRSEESSQGRSELFWVRGVHRSAAQTLDGKLRARAPQWETWTERLLLCSV